MTLLKALGSHPLRWVWVLVVVTFPLLLLIEYLAVAPIGGMGFLHLQLPFILLSMAALGGLILLPFIAFLFRRVAEFMAWWLACVVFLAAVLGGMKAGHGVRMSAFDRLAERSAPLVQAIRDYEREHGHAPETLEALVPKNLSSIPNTGMMGYPGYLYQQGPDVATRYAGNPWILSVHASRGFASYDEFLYFPLQNYPETGYGGRLERRRDWAYLHE